MLDVGFYESVLFGGCRVVGCVASPGAGGIVVVIAPFRLWKSHYWLGIRVKRKIFFNLRSD